MNIFQRLFFKPRDDYEREICSPNNRVKVTFCLRDGKMSYSIIKDDALVVGDSGLALDIKNDQPFGEGLQVVREHEKNVDESWETVVGEERVIENKYREVAFYMSERSGNNRILTMRFRVYDEGVAFRYEIPPQPRFESLAITRERTEFNIDVNSSVWCIPAYKPDRYEYLYEKRSAHELTEPVHTPATIETPNSVVVAIHEAALYNYGAMNLVYNTENYKLVTDIVPLSDGMKAHVKLPFETPWRTLIMSHAAIKLPRIRMMLNLNDPPKMDMSWVKPLKFLGIWWAMFVGEWTWALTERHGATTEHALEYIDACVRLGISGLLIEGWNYNWEGDWMENGDKWRFMEPYPDFDIDRVAKYATEHGVELVSHHETVGHIDNYERQMEDAYKYLQERNIHYIKSGYVGTKITIGGTREWHHSQAGVMHYQRAVETAAKYGIMLDVHEPIKSTGIERTWPNFLTREGARGQEYEGGGLSPKHVCTLPFTRLLAGGMDYTPGIFDVTNFTKRVASTLARQLALYVVIYSAMQMAADRPRFYEGEYQDAFKFIRDVPLNWEKTVPLLGAIGEYYIVARQGREDLNWYIGGVTNDEGRKINILFDFLDDGVIYDVELYRDGADAHYRERQLAYEIEQRKIKKGDRMDIYMAPGGGFAMRVAKPGGVAG
jgi:alpha-glucosidase